MLLGSGHTYERKAIEQHLRGSEIDPKSNVPIASKQLATNWIVRNVVQAWLDENPGVIPEGWDTRDMLPARAPPSPDPYLCAENGNFFIDARVLIEAGADVNAKTDGGWTRLHSSVKNGHLEGVRALIVAGADVNAKTDYGWTPLHESAKNGHLDIAKALIEAGADVNAKNFMDETPADLLSLNI